MYILHFPYILAWVEKVYFHNELFINLIFFLKFLLILVMKNKYLIIKSLKLFEKDKIKNQKILARSARQFTLPFPLKIHDTAT